MKEPVDQLRPYPTGRIFFKLLPGNKLPGYLHLVPSGQPKRKGLSPDRKLRLGCISFRENYFLRPVLKDVLDEANSIANLLEPSFVRIWVTTHPELSDTVLGPHSHYNPAALS